MNAQQISLENTNLKEKLSIKNKEICELKKQLNNSNINCDKLKQNIIQLKNELNNAKIKKNKVK